MTHIEMMLRLSLVQAELAKIAEDRRSSRPEGREDRPVQREGSGAPAGSERRRKGR